MVEVGGNGNCGSLTVAAGLREIGLHVTAKQLRKMVGTPSRVWWTARELEVVSEHFGVVIYCLVPSSKVVFRTSGAGGGRGEKKAIFLVGEDGHFQVACKQAVGNQHQPGCSIDTSEIRWDTPFCGDAILGGSFYFKPDSNGQCLLKGKYHQFILCSCCAWC
jgi:hypothetical protein